MPPLLPLSSSGHCLSSVRSVASATCTSVSAGFFPAGDGLTSVAKISFYDETCSFLFMAWALHYFPFFIMSRQLFLHHYLPALWFSVLLFCTAFDYLTSTLRPRTRVQIGAFFLILVIWSYAYFSPLSYAKPWTRGKCEKAKWLKTWDFSW